MGTAIGPVPDSKIQSDSTNPTWRRWWDLIRGVVNGEDLKPQARAYVAGSVYQNNTGKALTVCISVLSVAGMSGAYARVDTVNPPVLFVHWFDLPAGVRVAVMFVVPPGYYYKLDAAGAAVQSWTEY